MKYIVTITLSSLLAAAFMSGCAQKTERIDMHEDKGAQVMGLDYRDFNEAAAEAVQSMLQSGALDKKTGDRYVLAISRVTNDTMQHIDTDQLVKKIRVELLRSGKVVVTTAVGANGPEDRMSKQARELREDEEFNQRTVQEKGQMIAPDMSLSGKILQRNVRMDDGKQQVEYYFMLSLTEIKTGLAWWEGETIIGKRGSGKSVSW
ncbi:penicillin-binding protein activator LpoB [Sulfurimonas sp. HSL3-7]|uniref:penicillin-binding protein activator LpoB n=1 Tax=Sulfonitrofixus jiaomeiensis TaxID=3131938 RepID=UPI0031F95EF6